MKVFEREHIHAHCAGSEWPDPLGEFALGEPFVIETVRFNGVNGPIAVSGIRPGEAIARVLPIHVCPTEIVPRRRHPSLAPAVWGAERARSLRLFRVPAAPSTGGR